jgi:hypothetical protein
MILPENIFFLFCNSSNSVHRLKRQTNGQEITSNSIVNVNEFANGLTNIDVTRVVSTGCKTSIFNTKRRKNYQCSQGWGLGIEVKGVRQVDMRYILFYKYDSMVLK